MGSRDHSIACALCGLQRGGLNDYKCECDDLVDSGAVIREFADKARHIAEARDEACDIAERLYTNGAMPGYHELSERRIVELRNVGKG